mgnify:CR=1 FL=1
MILGVLLKSPGYSRRPDPPVRREPVGRRPVLLDVPVVRLLVLRLRRDLFTSGLNWATRSRRIRDSRSPSCSWIEPRGSAHELRACGEGVVERSHVPGATGLWNPLVTYVREARARPMGGFGRARASLGPG